MYICVKYKKQCTYVLRQKTVQIYIGYNTMYICVK